MWNDRPYPSTPRPLTTREKLDAAIDALTEAAEAVRHEDELTLEALVEILNARTAAVSVRDAHVAIAA